MRQILFAAGIALAVSILLTPVLIKAFTRQGFGQEIRVEGPQSHQAKRGTPTMGGVAILAGLWAGYWGSHLIGLGDDAEGPTASGLLVLGLTTALGGVGFLDDFIKIRKQRNLGLNKTAKLVGQLIAAVAFGILALQFRNDSGLTPGSTHLSYVRDIATVSMGSVVFILFVYLLVSAWSNAVNLTDGLDGLAAGSMSLVLGAYVIITFWQYRNSCVAEPGKGCYDVRDYLDGYYDDDIYYNNPVDYMPNLNDDVFLPRLRDSVAIVLITGQGAYESPGRSVQMEPNDVLAAVCATVPTLGDAIDALARYLGAWTQSIRVQIALNPEDGSVWIETTRVRPTTRPTKRRHPISRVPQTR